MKFYSVTRNGKDLGKFPESTFREMVKNQLLPKDALYWTEGMADWATIGSLTKTPGTQPPPPTIPRAQQPPKTKPPKASEEARSDDEDHGSFGSQLFRFFVGVGSVALIALFIFSKWAKTNRKAANELINDTVSQTMPAKTTPPSAPRLESPSPKVADNLAYAPYFYYGREIFAVIELAYVNVETDEEEEPAPADGPKLADNFGEGAIGVAIFDVKKGQTFTVEVRGDRFLRPSVMTVTAEKSAKVITVTPKAIFDFDALARLRQAVPINVYFSVQRGSGTPQTTTETFRVRPPNDCPIRMSTYELDVSGNVIVDVFDSSHALAAFVNETHPWIDQILKSAKRYSNSRTFTGYQAGHAAVRDQVTAIWKTLQSHNITYSNIVATTGSREHLIQHVRFLDETVSNQQANCVDGTVALCSIFQKIGLHTGIAIVPGHAYLIVYDKDNEEPLFGVETTLLASNNIEDAVQATRTGPYALDKVIKAIEEGKDGFTIVNIGAARAININPIPYSR